MLALTGKQNVIQYLLEFYCTLFHVVTPVQRWRRRLPWNKDTYNYFETVVGYLFLRISLVLMKVMHEILMMKRSACPNK